MTIKWLHLSDVHECDKDRYHRIAMYEAILAEVKANPPIDSVFFTGDLAFSGTAAEYKLLSDRFLTPLRTTLPASCALFMVPGNHDVDRKRVSKPRLWIVDEEEHSAFQNVGVEGQRKRADALLLRFEAYRELEAEFADWDQNWLGSEQGSICKLITVGSRRIAIVGINTAWLCQDDEDWGRLTAGRTMVDAALRQAEKIKPDCLIVLGHHPLAAMMGEKEWSDGDRIRRRLEQANAIYLHGHLHASGGQRTGEPMQSVLAIQAPSGFQAADSRIWRNGLLWGAVDFDSSRLIITPKRWNDEHRAYVFDSDAAAPSYRVPGQDAFSFPLPGHVLSEHKVLNRPGAHAATTQADAFLRDANFITNIVFDDDGVFIGREASLEELEDALWRGQGAAAITQAVAVHGLGGIGKTTLAVEYARRNRNRYRGVWRIRGEQSDTLVQDLALLRRQFTSDSLKEQPLDAARAALGEIERTLGLPFLLLFDNIESPDDMRGWWPATGAQVLITSRWRDWRASKAKPIPLEILTPQASTNLLLTLSNRTEDEGAGALAEKLGYLPLAISHAAAVLRQARTLSFHDYARNLEERIGNAPKGAGDYPAPVRGALESNLAMLARYAPDAHALLDLAAYCAPDIIPLSLWDTAPARAHLPERLQDASQLAESFGALESWSLASLTVGEAKEKVKHPTLSLHRLTQAVIRAHCVEAERDLEVLRVTVDALSALAGTAAELPTEIMNTVNPHAVTVRDHISEQRSNEKITPLLEAAESLVVRTTLHCSFCQKDRYEVNKLIVGTSVGICGRCVVRCDELFSGAVASQKGAVGAFTETGPFIVDSASRSPQICKLCDLEVIYYAVRKGDIVICDECVDLCMDILIEQGERIVRRAPRRDWFRVRRSKTKTSKFMDIRLHEYRAINVSDWYKLFLEIWGAIKRRPPS